MRWWMVRQLLGLMTTQADWVDAAVEKIQVVVAAKVLLLEW